MEKEKIFTPRLVQAEVEVVVRTDIGVMLFVAYSGFVQGGDQFLRSIRGAVVSDDNFDTRIGLVQGARDRLTEVIIGSVIGRDAYAHQWMRVVLH